MKEEPFKKPKLGEKLMKGIAASPGVALGKVCIHKDVFSHVPTYAIEDNQIGSEIQRLKKAVEEVEEAIRRDHENIRRQLGYGGYGDAEIFSTHLSIIKDSHFLSEVFEKIATQRINAEASVLSQILKYEEIFSKMEDAYFRERMADIRDIGKRLIESLTGPMVLDCPFEEAVIIAGVELTPKDTVQFKRERVLAFITERGGRESHAAILARSMGIPAVLAIEGLLSRIERGDFLIIDGNLGFVVVNPPEGVIQEYRKTQEKLEAHRRNLETLIDYPAETLDGHRFKLMANIGNMVDLEFSIRFHADGIGLFRTELPFIIEDHFLSEEEQFGIYKKVAERMNPKEVTIRTLDFGGDKFLVSLRPEKNPFLGYRSTRAFLKEQEMLKTQIRAIFRASVHGKVKILFPMVSSVEEVRQLRGVVKEVEAEFIHKKVDFQRDIPIGVMVEIPSLAIMASKLMKEIDFVSIGTNDLVQYTLAVDRDNDLVSDLYQPLNPSILWLVKNVVEAGQAHGKSVSICGEIAGDPFYFPLLYGLGLREFSVAPVLILEIKEMAKRVTTKEASQIAERAMEMDSSKEIEQLLMASYPLNHD
ncbi:MAG: phosphoenolpyruvate--protein phosphotransferase [Deltaproteobacteria bacterium]|nr:phosphoenolpyruvate--protein phosphotransferase [Deltaproteobacteria bacterium]